MSDRHMGIGLGVLEKSGTAPGAAGPNLHENDYHVGDRPVLRTGRMYFGRSARTGRAGRGDALPSQRAEGVHRN